MSKPLKIAHFTQFLGIGGLEKIILELSLEQMKQGHEVSVIVYDYEQGWVEFFRAQGIRVITSITKKDGFDLFLFSQFTKFIEKEEFDIIHSHDINPLLYLTGAKFIYTLRNSDSFRLIHTAHTLDHVENSKKVEFFERLLSHFSNQIITVSEKIKEFYIRTALIDPIKVNLIENGISLKSSSQTDIEAKKTHLIKEYNLDKNKPIALCLSRIVPLKDQLFLATIFEDLPHLQLLIVGPPSDPQYFEKIEKIAQDAPYRNIHLLGPRADVIELNEAADLYVSASTHEGLPVSVLEAMSVNCPCLVSNIAGHQILNNYDQVVETYLIGDRDDFLFKLDLLIQSLDNAKYKRGKEIVAKFFSTQKMARKYEEVYFK